MCEKKLKKENEEFFNNHLAIITENILNMNINENKIAYLEKDIINNIFDKENESDNYYSELSEDSNNFSIKSNFSLSEYLELKNLISKQIKLVIIEIKTYQKTKKKGKEVTINYKNLKNNLIHNKKLNNDSSSSDSDSSSNSSNLLKIEPESDNEDKYSPIKVYIALKNIIIYHKDISPEIIDLVDNDGNGNCLFLCLSFHFY